MIRFKLNLLKPTERWRITGQKTRFAANEIPNLLARGHMHGLSDGLKVAAEDVETLLEESEPPDDPTTDAK